MIELFEVPSMPTAVLELCLRLICISRLVQTIRLSLRQLQSRISPRVRIGIIGRGSSVRKVHEDLSQRQRNSSNFMLA